jgi:glycosyltransferase involved in cell wall biosynthesis
MCYMNHGMYFDFNERDPYRDPYKPNNRPQYGFINRKIAEAARQARAITVPSEWAAEPFKRDMRLSPTVIPNGVDLELWEGKHPNGHYVLWNKNRAGDVCDPGPAYELAKRGVSVVSTFVPADINQHELPGNLRVTGSIPFAEMRQLVLNADVYLATTQEIDSLSVKEAMAAGVPVLGFRWGGTAEVVRHKQEGYLVEPGDIGGLLEGLEWIRSNRDACSKAARERAQAYSWPKIIEKYARLYGEVYQSRRNERHRVSVVLTSFNYAGYLAQALESVLGQTKKPDEVVVVDDGSTDNTAEIARNYADRGVKLIRQENQGVANARNAGIAATNCEFVICLDADDALHLRYIEAYYLT